MSKTPDETKDQQFQNVVQHFLKTPPKPHALKKKPSRAKLTSRKPNK
jgi:hypothetical protein